MSRGFQHGRMREIPWDRQTPNRMPPHRMHTSETAINERMSQDMPPQWGPQRQRDYPFRRWKQEIKKWTQVTKVHKEKQGALVYSVLQGTASSHVQSWLSDPTNEDRRKERLRKGNRKYRIAEWNLKLKVKQEEALIAKLADLQIEHDLYGPGGNPTHRNAKGGGKGKADDGADIAVGDSQSEADASAEASEQETPLAREIFGSPASDGPLGRLMSRLPGCPIADSSSDESDTETLEALSGVDIVMHKLAVIFAENEQTHTMNVMTDYRKFFRMPHESMEEAYARWDVVVEEMGRQGLALHSPQQTAHDWFFIFHIPAAAHPLLLAQFDNKFPETLQELQRLREKIISHYRLVDTSSPYTNWSSHQRPPAGTHYALSSSELETTHAFPTWGSGWNDSYEADWPPPPAPYGWDNGQQDHNNIFVTRAWMSSGSSHSGSRECEDCHTSEAYIHQDDCHFDTDTESDDDNVEDEQLDKWIEQCKDDENLWNDLRQQTHNVYVTVKRRWRKVMGRPTRNRRQFNRRRPKGKGKGKGKAFLCTTCSSYYDVSEAQDTFQTFLVNRSKGKGKGKGKGKFPRRNPVGPDGQIMKCHTCGSETHLKRDCKQQEGSRTCVAFSIKEISEEGEEEDITEVDSSAPPTPEEVQLSFCYFLRGYSDGRHWCHEMEPEPEPKRSRLSSAQEDGSTIRASSEEQADMLP